MLRESFPRHLELVANPVLQDLYDESRAITDLELLGDEEQDMGLAGDECRWAYYENGVLRLTEEQVKRLVAEGRPTYSAYDAALASRRRVVGRLRLGGARIMGGVLRITEEQWSVLQGNSTDESHRFALDEGYVPDIDEVVAADQNKIDLRTAVDVTLEPYSLLFDHRVPDAESNERTLLRKRLKLSTSSVSWEIAHARSRPGLRYKFELVCCLGEERNTISRVGAAVMVDRSWRSAMEIQLDYASHGLAQIKLETNAPESGNVAFKKTIEKGRNGQPSGELNRLMQLSLIPKDLTLILVGERPRIIAQGIGDRNSFEYVFDPKSNVFVLCGEEGFTNTKGERLTCPRELSVSSFRAIVEDVFAVLPLEELKF